MVQFKEADKQKLLIFLLLLIAVAAVCVSVWALFFRTTDMVLLPDHAPMEEAHAQPIPGDTENNTDAEPGSGSVSLTYSNQVSVQLDSNTVQLYFANPGRSNQDAVLQLVIQNRAIFQSGVIAPGNQVTELDFSSETAGMLMPGGYDGVFLVHFYDPISKEKSLVTTEIPVSVTVAG